jgi:hypothetical protein
MSVVLQINPSEMRMIQLMAKAAERGGKSKVREDRWQNMTEDQLIGQIGAYAGHRYWYGHSQGYLQSRHVCNMYPDVGDGGSDIIGANIDFKASRVRSSTRPLEHYNLAVRKGERHTGNVYVLVLVETDFESATAHLMGWATDEMFPEKPASDGPLAGAFCIRADALAPMMPLHWKWVEQAKSAIREFA